METIYFLLSLMLISATFIPLFPSQHTFFRVFDFGRIQQVLLQAVFFILAFFLIENKDSWFWLTQALLFFAIIFGANILFPYTRLYPKKKIVIPSIKSEAISILSINVYQFNEEYHRLIELVQEVKPDILFTMESNKDWEAALSALEENYPFTVKVALENTYGMHLYSKLNFEDTEVNYFVSKDIPSIRAKIKHGKYQFEFYGVHPPPPSPTEERNSKERDGELLSVARNVMDYSDPVVVVGDFNNVAWSRSSVLFRKTSGLIDPRIGRGFISTYHAKYWFFRFPIDLFFHSKHIFIDEFKTLRSIGSDHLPLYCRFFICYHSSVQEEEIEELDQSEEKVIDEIIEEGIKEDGNRKVY